MKGFPLCIVKKAWVGELTSTEVGQVTEKKIINNTVLKFQFLFENGSTLYVRGLVFSWLIKKRQNKKM
jgi:hypothetical protein